MKQAIFSSNSHFLTLVEEKMAFVGSNHVFIGIYTLATSVIWFNFGKRFAKTG